MVVQGHMTLKREQEIVSLTKDWLSERAGGSAAIRAYLDRWGDWTNPWVDSE
jgi:hypothetical protein